MSSEEKELLHLLSSPHLKVGIHLLQNVSLFPQYACTHTTLKSFLTLYRFWQMSVHLTDKRQHCNLSTYLLPCQAVLSVHDTVAQKNFDPVLPPLPDDFEDELEEESVKIVRLVKNKEPLVSYDNGNENGASRRIR